MYWLAFMTGLAGSFHCFGMCGPLAFAIPLPHGEKIPGVFLYNLGRTLTYMALGILAGTLGLAASLGGFQKVVSLMAGVLLLLFLLLQYFSKIGSYDLRKHLKSALLKKLIAEQFIRRTYLSVFLTGVLNGLLPCGIVYLAITGSFAMSNSWEGAFYMMAFSLGTMPVMVSVFYLKGFAKKSISLKLIPIVSFVLACLLIYRGAGMEIPALDEALTRVGMGVISGCGNF